MAGALFESRADALDVLQFFLNSNCSFLQESVRLSDDENGLGVSDLGQLSDSLEVHFWRSMTLRYGFSEPT